MILRDIAIFHYKNGGKAPEISKLLEKFIEIRLIVGYIDTNNLVQFMLNGNLTDQKLVVQNNAFLV